MTEHWTLFDFDSTLYPEETMVALGAYSMRGVTEKKRATLLHKMQKITNLGMEDRISFSDSITERLRLCALHKDHVREFCDAAEKRVSGRIAQLVEKLHERGVKLGILSAGFDECIWPVAELLKIEKEHVWANTLLYDADGNVIDIDRDNPLSRSNGKVTTIRRLRKKGVVKGHVTMVGDGMSDARTKQKQGADRFIGYGEHRYSEQVKAMAETYCMTVAELAKELLRKPVTD